MLQPNQHLAHEQALIAEYWANPRPGLVSFGDALRHAHEAWNGIWDTDIGETIGRYVFHMTAGVEIISVPEGEIVPMPDENSRQVAKIVMDIRKLRFRPLSTGLNKLDADNIDDFDALAARMVDETLYFGPSASARIPGLGHGMVVDISRLTIYTRASKGGKFLTGLTSARFDEEGEVITPTTIPIPERVVGVPYRDSPSHLTRRIVSAAILEPTGMAWHRHRDDDDNRQKEPARERTSWRDWLPVPLPLPGH